MLPMMYWCTSFNILLVDSLILHMQLEFSLYITVDCVRKYTYRMYSVHQLMKIITSIHGRLSQM